MVAGGFDAEGKFLLAVSHSGRGLFEVGTWERVARDTGEAYPDAGIAIGIGPIADEKIAVQEIDYSTGVLTFESPGRKWLLRYTEGTSTISSASDTPKKNA